MLRKKKKKTEEEVEVVAVSTLHMGDVHAFEVEFGAEGLRQPLFAAGENCPRSISPATTGAARWWAPGGKWVKIRRYESYDRPQEGTTCPRSFPSFPSTPRFPDFADVPEGGSPTRNFRRAGSPDR